MFARCLAAGLLLVVGLYAQAAPTVYEFEGYWGSEKVGEGADARFGEPYLIYQAPIKGTITFDPERTQVDPESSGEYAAPLVSLHVESLYGGATIDTNANGTSWISATSSNGIHTVMIGSSGNIDLEGRIVEGDVLLMWSSTRAAPVPLTDLASLQPDNWTLRITNRGDCPPWCDASWVSELKAHITRVWTQGTPSAELYSESFDAMPTSWSLQGGAWATEAGVFRNLQNVSHTSGVYRGGLELGTSYDFGARIYSQWGAAGNTLGLLLHYRDSANFDEIRINSSGRATYNRVRRGARSTLATATYSGAAARTWFQFFVNRDGPTLRVGAANSTGSSQQLFEMDVGELSGGYTGVFASWNMARFDDFYLLQRLPWNLNSSTNFELFEQQDQWRPTSGDWSFESIPGVFLSGYYYSASNLPAAISTMAQPISKSEYSVDASMYLEWSASGNRSGVVYDYQDESNYRAVLVASGRRTSSTTSRGSLEVIEVRNGVRRVVHRVPELGGPWILPREWTPVGVRRVGRVTEVTAMGTRVTLDQTVISGSKRVGLIASYNKVRFDDVIVAYPR